MNPAMYRKAPMALPWKSCDIQEAALWAASLFVMLIGQLAQWLGTATLDADIPGSSLCVYLVFSLFFSKELGLFLKDWV